MGEIAKIKIDATKPGPEINPRMYGIFLEEINTGVDGGLYAELIRNRGFEDAKAPEGFVFRDGRWDNGRGYVIPYHFEVDKSLPYWSLVRDGGAKGSMSLDLKNPLNSITPRSCRLDIQDISTGRVGIANEGYWGIGIKEGEEYLLSFRARGGNGFSGPLTASLENSDSEILSAPVQIKKITGEWKQYHAVLKAAKTDPQARFVLTAGETGTVWLDMVSLFPKKTFRNRPNGLRPEIAQMIADLKPGFVRFPGGCVVEGATPENAYDWKKSIGPIEQREEIWNVWDYRRTEGMGFYEYLQFCEDIGAEPLYVDFAGQTCIYRHSTNVPMSEMQPIEDSFVDALEFANGPVNSKWGKLRAQAGHPAPFHLKMLEIGNENVGRAYEERYDLIYHNIKSRYPETKILANFPLRQSPTEMVDEHYYNSPRWFINNFSMYDHRDRSDPPVYIAEVAVTSREGGRDKGNLISALAEGVFLMGAERNSDVVRMVSYAPLLANVHGRTELAGAPPPWHGMIYFDSSRVFGTVSYYLWKLFSENRPDRTLETDITYPDQPAFKLTGQIGVGTWDTRAEFKDIRVEQNGKLLYASDKGSTNMDEWQPEQSRRRDRWQVENGVYRQNQPGRASSYLGGTNWSDYTLTLKARKLGGGEGFLIMFGRKDGDMYWWNVGGWGNTRFAIEHSVQGTQTPVGQSVNGHIETGRWYDIKIQLSGARISCYLDGKLIHDETAGPDQTLFAVAGRDDAKKQLVLKVINTSPAPSSAKIDFNGIGHLSSKAHVTLLTSAELSDNNSLDEPRKVVPQASEVSIPGNDFNYEFPPNSLTVLRLSAQ
ncbi:MAG TPA: alpha-L-arabinofuranosidase C-terminal domain-containing protein [Verrucomicrobiae bacterium]|nr:alpha-L-arabinofuranosidase C-terminal domain-containing protein [Verrucomicrobiae bacterium]